MSASSSLTSLSTTQIVLGLFLFIGALAYIASTESYEVYKRSRTKIFVSMLAALAGLLIAIQIIMQSLDAKRLQQTELVTRTVEANENDYQKLLEWLNSDQVVLPSEAQLWPSNERLPTACKDPTSKSCSTELATQYTSQLLAKRISNYLAYRAYDETGDVAWLSLFLGWTSGSEFQAHYQMFRPTFRPLTQRLIDLLIEYSNKEKPKSAVQLEATAKKLVQDKRFKDITSE
jgi:hypothetical protein